MPKCFCPSCPVIIRCSILHEINHNLICDSVLNTNPTVAVLNTKWLWLQNSILSDIVCLHFEFIWTVFKSHLLVWLLRIHHTLLCCSCHQEWKCICEKYHQRKSLKTQRIKWRVWRYQTLLHEPLGRGYLHQSFHSLFVQDCPHREWEKRETKKFWKDCIIYAIHSDPSPHSDGQIKEIFFSKWKSWFTWLHRFGVLKQSRSMI